MLDFQSAAICCSYRGRGRWSLRQAAAVGRGLSDFYIFIWFFTCLHILVFLHFFIYFFHHFYKDWTRWSLRRAAAVGRGLSDGGEMQQRTAIGRCPPFTILIFIGPRCPWSDLCVQMSVRPSVCPSDTLLKTLLMWLWLMRIPTQY